MRRATFAAPLLAASLTVLVGGVLLGLGGCGEELKAVGEPCTADLDCLEASCHVSGVCAAATPLARGASCTADAQCKSLACAAGVCAAGVAEDGAVCAAGAECASENCDKGVCGLRLDGTACTADAQCEGGVCYSGACTSSCKKSDDCPSGSECRTDDGKRLICIKPGYKTGMGSPCAPVYSCPGDLKCTPFSAAAPAATASCTGSCKTDLDCPAAFRCAGDGGDKSCVRRGFCDPCLHDGQCAAPLKCADFGGSKICSLPCTAGSTECPRFADCKAASDGNSYCMHKAGACTKGGDLCDPCRTDDNCKGNVCLTLNSTKESFCGSSCSSATCPTGYSCYDIKTGSGSSKQCAPDFKTKTSCVTISPTMEVGDVMADFAMVGVSDVNKDGSVVGDPARVYRLSEFAASHKVILFNLSAGWCGPCLAETKEFAGLMKKYESKGLLIFQALYDGAAQGTLPTLTLLGQWIGMAKPLGVIGIDPARDAGPYNTAGTTPLNMLLDAKTRKVLEKWNGFSVSSLESKLAKFLQ